MSLKRWNAKRDANEADIVAAIRRVGAEVILLEPFDLLVMYRRRVFMLDCKVSGGRPTARQLGLVAVGWPLQFISTPEEALKAIGALR